MISSRSLTLLAASLDIVERHRGSPVLGLTCLRGKDTLKEATVRTYHYQRFLQLRWHVADYLAAYNFAKHLKALRWKRPYETIRAL